MTDKNILRVTAAFCTSVLAYFIVMTAPVLIPSFVALVTEAIKQI